MRIYENPGSNGSHQKLFAGPGMSKVNTEFAKVDMIKASNW